MGTDRREFLGAMLAAGVTPALVGQRDRGTEGRGVAGGPSHRPSVQPSASPWDVSWADKVTGKHKEVFDNIEVSMALGLLRSQLWMNDYAEVYNATPADMSGVVVLRHNAIWLAMDDAFWSHHHIGAMLKVNDPKTKLPLARNLALGSNVIGIPPAMGDDILKKALSNCTVLACNVAFSLLVVEKVKADMKVDDAKAREMALPHLVSGVILQPSGVFAVTRAQEAGCHYFLASEA